MEFKLFSNEIEDLVGLLTQNEWTYHSGVSVKEESLRKAYENGTMKISVRLSG